MSSTRISSSNEVKSSLSETSVPAAGLVTGGADVEVAKLQM